MSTVDHPQLPELGYWFSPKSHPNSPGYHRLDVAIYNTASNLHFDPKLMQIPVFTAIDKVHPHGIEHMEISHPWRSRLSYQVVPGMLTISDRTGKKVKVFTFGARLKIIVSQDYTKCILESDAPIIEVSGANVLVMKLVEEAEILLAEQRAAWVTNEDEFSDRLQSVSSDILYAVCLQELRDRIDHSPNKDSQTSQDLRNFIIGEKRSLTKENLWPEEVPPISELL
jgi:hypothetical protein